VVGEPKLLLESLEVGTKSDGNLASRA
jgi:hypothetical protein